MLERCEFCELNEEVLRECGGFSCKDGDITEFFTKEYADYAYQLLGKSYCFVEQEKRCIVGAFTVANSSIRADLLPNSRRNKLNRNIPNEKRRPQYPAVLVGQLAVSEDYKGLHVGDELLDAIKSWFIEPLNKTGCRYVVVDALNHSKVFDFYQRNGFKFLFATEEEEWTFLHGRRTAKEGTAMQPMHTRLMYFDLILLRTE
ncbi:GNAT family N-acetyltransferase [Phocaeicola barnesiae]